MGQQMSYISREKYMQPLYNLVLSRSKEYPIVTLGTTHPCRPVERPTRRSPTHTYPDSSTTRTGRAGGQTATRGATPPCSRQRTGHDATLGGGEITSHTQKSLHRQTPSPQPSHRNVTQGRHVAVTPQVVRVRRVRELTVILVNTHRTDKP